MIIFVGDDPSPYNFHQDVAFIGSKSGDVLYKWIKDLGITSWIAENSHTEKHMSRIVELHRSYKHDAIIALGNNASKRLSKAGVPHFKLPHPSPRNRKLNDKSFVVKELNKCKEYLLETYYRG